MFNKQSKTPFLIGGLVIAIVLALTGFYSQLINFLVLLGIFIPPLGGVMLGDYFFIYRRKLPRLEYIHFKLFRLGPVLAYVVGAVVAFITDRLSFGIPPLFGIVVSAACVPLFDALLKKLGVNDRHAVDENAETV